MLYQDLRTIFAQDPSVRFRHKILFAMETLNTKLQLLEANANYPI